MAKLSVIVRQKKREVLIEKYREKRDLLRRAVVDPTKTSEERFNAMLKLQKLPRNSMPARSRNRCGLTGRGRGYMGRFGVSRIKFRELAGRGEIPGLRMSSW